jgi:hypothetical protein
MKTLSIPWFREEDWPRWRSIDPDFQSDYPCWLGRFETVFERYEAMTQIMGHRVIKVVIDPDEFLKWSRANVDGKTDNMALAAFAAYKAMRIDAIHLVH